MDVTLLYFEGCPNWREADAQVRALAAERGDLQIRRQRIASAEDADRQGFHGSPTILVDGVDPFADPAAPTGLACRIYDTPDGPAGAPTIDQLRDALDRLG